MTVKGTARYLSFDVLMYSIILYIIPFIVLTLLSRLAFNSIILHEFIREAAWWMYFFPALILPYYFGLKGTKLVVGFSVSVLALILFLHIRNSMNHITLIDGVLTTLSSVFISLCVGILSDSFSGSNREAQEQNRQLKSLFKSSELLAYTLDPQEVLNQSLTIIRKSLGFDYAEIWLLENNDQLCVAASNLPPIDAPAIYPANQCLPGLVLAKGESMYSDDPLNDERIIDKTWIKQLDLKSEAMLPLIHRGEKLGVLIMSNKKKYSFTEDRCELLQTFVNQLALSIKNAKLYQEMEQKAILDGATGLYNYRFFQECLEKEVKRVEREGGYLSLLMMDLDYFKEYNDTFGHPAGDDLLREFGRVLMLSVRDTDICVRYGGDEFAVILPQTDAEGAIFLAERIIEQVEKHRFRGFERMPGGTISLSVGSATYPHPAHDSVELVKLADNQLYKMKEVRRNIRKATS